MLIYICIQYIGRSEAVWTNRGEIRYHMQNSVQRFRNLVMQQQKESSIADQGKFNIFGTR